ncbi:DUF4861 domain-containing protein [Hallella bergensis]|uniref:DUF4861 domain-containing protein n=1 Tax=Hallella bergensis TaxID=242750 RepID=UPI003990B17D
MKRNLLLIAASMGFATMSAQQVINLTLSSKVTHPNAPIVMKLADYDVVKSALVTIDGVEIPCQLDDLNKDGRMDELSFIADVTKNNNTKATITLSDNGKPREYKPMTYAEIVLRSGAKEKNKQNIYLSAVTIDKQTVKPYNVLHHHGVAFENEMIAMRIYMDHRQTIDLYGKFHKGLELKETQFYTSKEQKAQGYGDDVLWVGNSFGLGALRGWNGSEPTMLDDVQHRTHRILAQGPIRTIVEVEDIAWTISPGTEPVNMTLRYTLYTGHRDFDVDVAFNRDMSKQQFSTGIINVKNSIDLSDRDGMRGCWGTDWPSADTINWKRETVGLGIYIPKVYRVKEMPADKDNYCIVLKPVGNTIHYNLTYTSANEEFGYHSAKEWNGYLKEWKKRKANPVVVRKE